MYVSASVECNAPHAPPDTSDVTHGKQALLAGAMQDSSQFVELYDS
jgi:hypothetical protein